MIGSNLSSTEFIMQIAALLSAAGLSPNVLSIKNCTQGKNNRTYRIHTVDGPFVIKQYLRQEGDTRDRLAAEFAFLSYAKAVAPRQVPQPFFQDLKQSMALYEFMEGRPLQPEEVTTAEVDQAAEFFCALNEPQTRAHAATLPVASEACFSLQEHLALISARIALLQKITPEADAALRGRGNLDAVEDQAAKRLIQRLSDYWQKLAAALKTVADNEGLDLTACLDPSQRCISPSDFGFHNALKMPDGSLCFLDFEYAGWDDPAKMTGDFFSQLALPVPENQFNGFVAQVMQSFARSEELIRRAQLLRRVYRVKWCCIALNIFLPVHLARYRFANPSLKVADFKRKQLDKVTHLIQALETQDYGLH